MKAIIVVSREFRKINCKERGRRGFMLFQKIPVIKKEYSQKDLRNKKQLQ